VGLNLRSVVLLVEWEMVDALARSTGDAALDPGRIGERPACVSGCNRCPSASVGGKVGETTAEGRRSRKLAISDAAAQLSSRWHEESDAA
jgi:hypothetical protein